jgi:serine/threonine protein kinase
MGALYIRRLRRHNRRVPEPERERAFGGSARFLLRRRLGEGGTGVVWEAHDRERLTTVALKTLRTLAPDALLRFKHEFRALQDVTHPNLVSLGELIEEGGQWFFTMELVCGVHLLRWVRPHEDLPYDEGRLRTSFAQLADALEALHARGLKHRSLKASSVLVTGSGRAVLLDLAVVAADDGAAGDWYALGAVLYEALTGRAPDRDAAQAPSPRALAPEVADDLDALCRALLDRDAAARPTAREVLRRLGVAALGRRAADGALRRARGRAGAARRRR